MAQSISKAAIAGWAVAGVLALVLAGRCTPAPQNGNTAIVATGATKYVSARALNCRATASTAAVNVRSLTRGEQVTVVEESAGWSRLGDKQSCWVSTAFLSSEPSGAATSASATAAARANIGWGANGPSGPQRLLSEPGTGKSDYSSAGGSESSYRPARKARKRRSGGGYGGGACPCSGNNVCIGPRGGRYCITSGGNKRYGV